MTQETNSISGIGAASDSEVVDNSALPKVPTIKQEQGGHGRGHGRSGGAGGIHGGRESVGEGVNLKHKAGSDMSGLKAKKPRNVLPPREMSKRCAFHSLIYIQSSILIQILHSIHGETYANSLVKIREPRKL